MPLPAPKKSETGKKITLNLASRLLTLYEGTEKVRIYPVAVGAPETPSPVGEFSISEKEVNPSWTDPKTEITVPSGPSILFGDVRAGPLRELRYSWDERAMVYRSQCISRLYPYV